MSIVCFGDIHLSDERAWGLEVGEKLIEYFETLPENNFNNVAILLGDLTEKTNLSGHVYDLLVRLFASLRFRKTYVIQGNHDIKKKRNGSYSTPLKLLEAKSLFPQIELITSVTHIEEEDLSILALPFKPQSTTFNLKNYEELKGEYDIVVGHLADNSNKTVREEKIDLGKIRSENFCLGHIHTRVSPSYIGSMIPNDDSQCEQKYIRVYTHLGAKHIEVEEKKISSILTYASVKYPDPLPVVDSEVVVWTIDNCREESTARTHYGDIHIRQCNYEVKIDFDQFTKYTTLTTNSKSKEELVDEWIKENSPQLTELTRELIRKYNR